MYIIIIIIINIIITLKIAITVAPTCADAHLNCTKVINSNHSGLISMHIKFVPNMVVLYWLDFKLTWPRLKALASRLKCR